MLWRSDSQRTLSDEVLTGSYTIKDLEEGGKLSIQDELARPGIRRSFQPM